MARIKLVEQNEATGAEKERYDELAGRNAGEASPLLMASFMIASGVAPVSASR